MTHFNEWFHLAWSVPDKTKQRGFLESSCHLPIPSIDLLLLDGSPVELCPGPHVIQPGQHLLGAPAGHRLTDQYVMLVLLPTAAPVVHQQHHLAKHKQARFKRGTQCQGSASEFGSAIFLPSLRMADSDTNGGRKPLIILNLLVIGHFKSLFSLTFTYFCKSRAHSLVETDTER